MTTDEFVQALTLRGLMVAWANGRPVLQGPKHMATPALLRVLQHHRDEIVRRVRPKPEPPPPERPRIVRWTTAAGTVFTTIPGTSPGKPVAWPYAPVEATAFAWDGGYDYRPLSELPPAWGLKRLDTEAD